MLQNFYTNIDIVSAILFSKTIEKNNKSKIKIQELKNRLKEITTKLKKQKKNREVEEEQ